MKRVLPSALVGWFLNYARRLKHPQLFKWICALFLIDLIIPDLVPFVDEILLGLATMFLASWKRRERVEPESSRQEKAVSGHAEYETKETGAGKTSASQTEHGKH